MMPAKKRDFVQAVLRKGFVESTRRDHRYYIFTDSNGQVYNSVHTKISHGAKGGDIPDSILSAMKAQLKFDSKGDFDSFIKCTFTEDEYRELLRKKGYRV